LGWLFGVEMWLLSTQSLSYTIQVADESVETDEQLSATNTLQLLVLQQWHAIEQRIHMRCGVAG
jgi:predicted metal-dependent hydrolase